MRKGFTLIELMIVVAIIAIIAALAIPSLLSSQIAANEVAAQKALMTLAQAQSVFRTRDPEGDGQDYATTLASLRDVKDQASNRINLIDAQLASGSKQGYTFGRVTLDESAVTYNMTYRFGYYAVPASYGDTGIKTFIINHNSQVYYKDTGSNTIVTRWPANDPASSSYVAAGGT